MRINKERQVNGEGFLILPEEFTDKGFWFKQVFRSGMYAIYERGQKGVPQPHFEAIKIMRHNGYTIAGVTMPPAEVYPSAEWFGTNAYCCPTMEKAKEKIKYLQLS